MRKSLTARVEIVVVRSTNGSVARFCSVLGLGLLIAACGRTARQDGAVNARAGAGAVGGSDASGAGAGGEPQCPGTAAPPLPLRLLREHELRTDLSDAFGSPVEIQVAPESSPHWADLEPYVSADFVYGQAELARKLARDVSQPAVLAKLTDCDVALDGEQRCRALLRIFVLMRLFRGLGTDQTSSELDAVFDTGLELGGDFHSGARAMLEVALQSPEYLYHLELARPAVDRPAGWGKLTDLELASRLSFLLWDSGPDDELLAVARQGLLGAPVELEKQARRLLRDERARVPVRRFYRQLMGVADEATLGPQRFPDFTAAVAHSLPAAFDRFIDDVTWDAGGDFRTLLRSPRAWFDSEMGQYYGVGVGAEAELQLVEQDPAYYSGLLTQSAFLARPNFATYPIFRAGAIARAFSCLEIPAHPIAFGDQDPQTELWGRPLVEEITAETACAGCHRYIDSAGFALEYFDASGRFRDTDNGVPVNARGELRYADESQPFDGAPELAELIVGSSTARDCFVRQWQTFAYGTRAADADACAQQQLTERFEASGGNILDLIVGLTLTDSFSYRAIPEDQP